MGREDGKQKRRGYHHGNLREALIDTALSLISQKGPAGFTIAEAARAAGVSPAAPYFQGADVLLAADCVPFAVGNFHQDFLKGKALAIACPKLDDGQDIYAEKLKGLFEESGIKSLTVAIMEVPCCRGLAQMAVQAWEKSSRKAPVKTVIVGLRGEVLQEDWLRI